MKKPIMILLLVTLLVAGVSTLAFASGPFRGQTPPQWGMRRPETGSMCKGTGPFWNLTLTSEQKEKMLEIQKKNFETIQNLQNQIQSARLTLQELSLKPASAETADQIRAKIKEIADLRQQIQEARNNMYQEFLNLLTPEQLTQLLQYQGSMGRGIGPTPWERW